MTCSTCTIATAQPTRLGISRGRYGGIRSLTAGRGKSGAATQGLSRNFDEHTGAKLGEASYRY